MPEKKRVDHGANVGFGLSLLGAVYCGFQIFSYSLDKFGGKPGFVATEKYAVIALVAGAVGLLLSIVALVRLRKPEPEIRGSGLAKAGIVLGIIAVCLGFSLFSIRHKPTPEEKEIDRLYRNLSRELNLPQRRR